MADGAALDWRLVAVEELVYSAVRPFVEVVDEMDAHDRSVRARAAEIEGERAVHRVPVLVEASPLREATGEAWQARILQRHRHERARLGERRVDAAVVEDGLVLDEVAGGRDRVERATPRRSSGSRRRRSRRGPSRGWLRLWAAERRLEPQSRVALPPAGPRRGVET